MKNTILLKIKLIRWKLYDFYDYLEGMNDFFMILHSHVFKKKIWFRSDLLNESIQNFRKYLK